MQTFVTIILNVLIALSASLWNLPKTNANPGSAEKSKLEMASASQPKKQPVTKDSTRSGAAMKKKGTFLEYKIGEQLFEGYLTGTPTKGAIVLVPNWLGISDEAISKSDQIAALGYRVLAADIYGKGIRPKNAEEAKAETAKYYTDRKLLRERALGAFKELKALTENKTRHYGAVGYCFGGTTVLELARAGADLNSVVTFHGGLDSPNPQDGKNIKAKLLILHGADDPFISPENLVAFENEMRSNKLDWQLIKYGGAVHSFTDKNAGNEPKLGAAYNESADERSWNAMTDFLKNTMK